MNEWYAYIRSPEANNIALIVSLTIINILFIINEVRLYISRKK